MIEELLFLGAMAFVAGLIDSAVGGGGLIQIPALFNALPEVNTATLFGTNKFSSIFGTASAARSFMRRVRLPWALILPAAGCAFVFSFAGAAAVSLIPKEVMKPAVLVLLVGMAIYTLWKKDFGKLHKPAVIGQRERWLAALIGGAIGFYDGIFGPGTGSFLIFLFIRFFGLDFLGASASAKIVNLATNVAALCWFVPAGQVLLAIAAPMAVANVAGAVTGSWLAMRGGSGLIRRLFLGLVCVLIVRMGWDTLQSLA